MSSIRKWFCGLALLLFLGAGSARAEEVLINGKPRQLSGSTSATFWMSRSASSLYGDAKKYKILGQTDFRLLLEGATIKAPPGFVVKQDALNVNLEETSNSHVLGRTRYTTTYQTHRISGKWTVTVPADCPEGDYKIEIHLPAVARLRDGLKATEPSGETSIVLFFKTYTTERTLAVQRWTGHFWKGVGCLAAMTVTLSIVGFAIWALFYAGAVHGIGLAILFGIPAGVSVLGYVGFMGRALSDLHSLNPAAALGVGLGVNVAYFLLFWLISGCGGWNRVWANCLGVGAVVVLLASAAVYGMPHDMKYIAEGRVLVPWAVAAMLPGLLLAWLLAALKPAAGAVREQQPDPQAEADLDAVKEHLQRLLDRR